MIDKKTITEAQLHAFIDHELHGKEQTDVHNIINENPELLRTANEMRHDMDMVAMAYRDLPTGKFVANSSVSKYRFPNRRTAIATAASLFLGTVGGWFIASHTDQNASPVNPVYTMVNSFDPVNLSTEKILIHVNTMDKTRVTSALDKIEQILEVSRNKQRNVKLEFVASVEGLPMLRQGSPYAEKIEFLTKKYDNVEFMACGVAMEVTRLKENHEVMLLPEVKQIPAAVDEIIKKLEAGWAYAGL